MDITSTGQKSHKAKGHGTRGALDKRTTVVGRKVQPSEYLGLFKNHDLYQPCCLRLPGV